jgi:uncharacterized protein (TIGR02118 family)
MVKQMLAFKRKPGMTFDEFKKYYIENHAPLVERVMPDLRKYVVNFALQRGKETPFDVINELYWDDFHTIVKLAKSDVYKNIVVLDEKQFVDSDSIIIHIAEEFIQKKGNF